MKFDVKLTKKKEKVFLMKMQNCFNHLIHLYYDLMSFFLYFQFLVIYKITMNIFIICYIVVEGLAISNFCNLFESIPFCLCKVFIDNLDVFKIICILTCIMDDNGNQLHCLLINFQ